MQWQAAAEPDSKVIEGIGGLGSVALTIALPHGAAAGGMWLESDVGLTNGVVATVSSNPTTEAGQWWRVVRVGCETDYLKLTT